MNPFFVESDQANANLKTIIMNRIRLMSEFDGIDEKIIRSVVLKIITRYSNFEYSVSSWINTLVIISPPPTLSTEAIQNIAWAIVVIKPPAAHSRILMN